MRQRLGIWLVAAMYALAAASCGGGNGKSPDGGAANGDGGHMTGDGGDGGGGTVDAGPPADAPPPGKVTITVRRADNTAVVGVDVLFSNPDGTVVSRKPTDTNGQASETLASGSMVTLALGAGTSDLGLDSIGDVQPGDNIVISNFGAGATSSSTAGQVTVAWPGAETGATSYFATDGCLSASTADPSNPTPLSIGSACLDGSNRYNLLAQAVMSSGGLTKAVAASVVLAHSFTNGQTVTLPAWSTSFRKTTVQVTNPPQGTLSTLARSTFFLGGHQYDLVDDAAIAGSGSFDAIVPAGIAASKVQAIEPTATAVIGPSFMAKKGTGFVIHKLSGEPSTDHIDFATELPRIATDGVFDTSDPARPKLSWTVTGTDTITDVTQVHLFWTDGGKQHSWNLVTNPREDGPIAFPAMPAALAAFAPTTSAQYGQISVSYVAADWVTASWSAIRQAGGPPPPPASAFKIATTSPYFALPAAPITAPAPSARARFMQQIERLESGILRR